jgi:hypothetical protein
MIEIPVPSTLLQFLWIGVGLQLTLAYGEKLDEDICGSGWFTGIPEPFKGLIERTLKFIHHWILGLILVVYAIQIGAYVGGHVEEVLWLGWGIFSGDVLDYPIKNYVLNRATPSEESTTTVITKVSPSVTNEPTAIPIAEDKTAV